MRCALGRRLACADIHGHGRRLVQLLSLANYDPAHDRLFLLGDYVDRGPEPAYTVQVAQELHRAGAVCLLGNHDAVLLAYAQGDGSRYAWLREWAFGTWAQQGGGVTLRDYGGTVPSDVVDFLASLPLYHEEPDCILVHAGLKPGVPLSAQTDDDLLWIRREFHEDYRGKLVIFGHTPTSILHERYSPPGQSPWVPWYGVDKVGIDTGAVWGGPLTLLDLDSGQLWTA